jgi:hypothetical protein
MDDLPIQFGNKKNRNWSLDKTASEFKRQRKNEQLQGFDISSLSIDIL